MQKSRRAPARLALSVPLDKIEATWSRRSEEQIHRLLNVFQESKVNLRKRSQEEQARMRNLFQGQLKSFSQEYRLLFKDFRAHQEQEEAKTQELVLQNRALWVGLPVLCLSTGFLIFQQNAALEEKTERMKLERKFNVLGALGM